MKKLIFILIISTLFFTCQRNATKSSKHIQEEFCGVDLAQNYDSYLEKIIELQAKYPVKSKRVLVFPVKFHYVSDDGNMVLSEVEIEASLANLNESFKSCNIQFKREGLVKNIYGSSKVDDLYNNKDFENNFVAPYSEPQHINLFVFSTYDQVVGFTHYPNINNNLIFIAQEKMLDPSLTHEFGHFFGLLHTFETSMSAAEIVGDNFCKNHGDKICDTPADPLGASFLEDECSLFGEYKDQKGNTFKPDLTNFMSYYGKCRSRFTIEQRDRMYFIAAKIKWKQMREGV